MSQENVEIVRRSIEAFQHDEEAWLSTSDPAIVWHPIEEGHIPSRGHEAAIGVRRRWLESWEDFQIDVEEVKDGADSVVACGHLTGQGKRSGVEVDLRIYMHYKLRDGKIVYVYEYADRDAALEAAGLSERAMSQENVELVRRFLEAVDRVFAAYWQAPRSMADSLRAGEVTPELADVMRYLHPNIEWKSALIGITTRGYEGTLHGVDQFLDAAQDYQVNASEVTDLSDSQVLAVVRLAMKGKASDIDVNATIFTIVTVEDGLIIRMDEYLERAEALEAVGLSEQDAHADS